MYASQGTYVPSAHLEGGVPEATDYSVDQGMYHEQKHTITDFRTLGATEKNCYLYPSRRTAKWNVSSLSNKETGTKANDTIYTSIPRLIINKNQSKWSEKI